MKAPVDGFHEATNTVFQFHSCFWHGCPKCYRDRAAKNTVNEETFDALYIKTIRRTQQLRNAGCHVIEKWSCEFSDEDRQRAHEFGIESKVPQLVPKDAFFGGRTEAIHLRKTLSEDDIQNGKEILYYDVTSEYPFVNSRKEYPVGHPKIFLKHQVPQTNEEWQRRGFFGAALCTIVPPKKLLHPDQPLCKKKYSSLESRSTSPHFVRFRLTRLLAPHIFFTILFHSLPLHSSARSARFVIHPP